VKGLRAILILIGAGGSGCAVLNTVTLGDLYGRWRVSEVVGYARVGAGIPHAKEILGKTVANSADVVSFNGDFCRPNVGFRVFEADTAKDLSEKSGATRVDAALPPRTPLLTGENCIEFYWLNQYKIEFDDDGVFFRAYRE